MIAKGGTFGDLPTLWLHGGDDQLVPLSGNQSGIEAVRGSGLTEQIYPAGGHALFDETNKDEVLDDVTSFVDHALAARHP
jgi:alpha-beta hydrolase superfamily lysophospholipase